MSYETLKLAEVNGILRVTLNRPGKKNALSEQMITELTDMALSHGTKARAIILDGEGDVFCAGGDLNWMKAQINADRATRITEARKLAMMLKALNEMPCPLISQIHGGAFGGGVGIACVSDVAIASNDCKFGLTETRLGLIPATIGPYVIARMGEGNARQVFMSSRIFGSAEAEKLGIIAKAVPADDLERAAFAQASPYLKVAPKAVASAKALARALGPTINDAVIDDTIRRLADTWEDDEALEGIDAFLNKRSAKWVQKS